MKNVFLAMFLFFSINSYGEVSNKETADFILNKMKQDSSMMINYEYTFKFSNRYCDVLIKSPLNWERISTEYQFSIGGTYPSIEKKGSQLSFSLKCKNGKDCVDAGFYESSGNKTGGFKTKEMILNYSSGYNEMLYVKLQKAFAHLSQNCSGEKELF